ncbi:Nrap protein [Syncephalis plumigaleata]|nr:Nrap protein [Syncephalis plumigaleata]
MPIAMKRKLHKERGVEQASQKKKTVVEPVVDTSDNDYISDDGEDLMTKAQDYESASSMDSDASVEEMDMDEDANSMSDAASMDESDEQVSDNTKESHDKTPSNEEIQSLQDTVELFKSNLFKLQIDEMLNEVRINYRKVEPLEKALHQIKSILDCHLEHDGYTLNDAIRRLDRDHVKIPFPEPKPNDSIQYTFAWKRPAAIHLVGSYAIKAIAKNRHGFNVDIAVEMPKDLFTEKDILNYRYFHKRAYYLAEMASALKRASPTSLAVHLSYTFIDNDPRRPILVLTGNGKGGDTDISSLGGVCIRIFPALNECTLPIRKLAPGRNCVRPQFIGQIKESNENENEHEDANRAMMATPRYNASLLADTLFKEHLAYLYAQTKTCPGLVDACALARVWLYQRGFGQKGRVFNGFLWSMLTVYLLHGGNGKFKLASGFSSYQLFKGTMDFIANHDFKHHPIIMNKTPPMEGEFTASEFTRHYSVVIIDPTHRLNLAAGITLAELELLQYEARLAMACFRDANRDTFAPLFLCHVDDPRVQNDYSIRIPLASINHPDVAVNEMDRVIRGERVARRICQLLRQGLTNRARLVTYSFDVLSSWKINQDPAYTDRKQRSLLIGLLVDPEHVARQVDKGPSPEDKAAADEFRQLWGDNADYDGSIVESVVWQNDDRSLIIRDMALYLIQRHLGVSPSSVENEDTLCFVGTQLNEMTRLPGRTAKVLGLATQTATTTTPTTTFQPVMLAFNQLSKQLKSLSDLPLDISAVLPAHASLYYGTLFPPQSRTFTQWSRLPSTARYLEPMDIVLQFERSGAWPEDLVAIQHMKSAFYLKIREQLLALNTGYRATVATAPTNINQEITSLGYVDIYTPTGFVFRCRIEHTPEVYILRRLISGKDTLSIKCDYYNKALTQYEHLYTHCPTHALQLQALGQRYPALSDTLRLTKRWFAAHMLLGDHLTITDQAVELLCAAVFVDAAPWQPPGTGHAGFARVLRLLHTWSWQREPLIVDLNESVTAEQRETIHQSFQQQLESSSSSSLGMIIATGQDPSGNWWRANQIDAILVARISQLAKASYTCIEQALNGHLNELKRIFTPSMTDYDIVLQLNPHACPRYLNEFIPLNLISLSEADYNVEAIPVGFDPIECYLQDLQAHFGRLAYFFHDRYGGTAIGVVWRRPMLTAKPLRVHLDYSTRPIQTKQVVPNLTAIIAEMRRLGQGIVDQVQVQRDLDNINN